MHKVKKGHIQFIPSGRDAACCCTKGCVSASLSLAPTAKNCPGELGPTNTFPALPPAQVAKYRTKSCAKERAVIVPACDVIQGGYLPEEPVERLLLQDVAKIASASSSQSIRSEGSSSETTACLIISSSCNARRNFC
jgi:hypothetical protein